MADADFTIEGWDEFVERFADLVDKWEAKKEILLTRMANIYHSEIIPLVPVDTSRLVDSIFVGGIDGDEIEVGTNVKYALFVNDGHVQHRRFLPCRKVTAGGKTRFIYSKGSKTGIMLQERYVAGVHFMEKGMTSAKPRLENLINSFMEQIKREVEGGSL
jgi:hypothetical protein